MTRRSNVRTWAGLAALLAVASMVLLCGCSKTAEDLSKPSHMFDVLSKNWQEAKATLQTDKPMLGQVAAIENILSGPMRRTIEQEYSASNKAEVLAKYDALAAGFRANVTPMLARSGYAVVLNSGYTNQNVHDAFMKLDTDFEALVKVAR